MLLHEAIIHVIEQNSKSMSSSEIAEEINRQGLYIRGDENPVPASQISARINNVSYKRFFTKIDGLVGLNS